MSTPGLGSRLCAFLAAGSANHESRAFIDAVEGFNSGEFELALQLLGGAHANVSTPSQEFVEIQNLQALVLIAKGEIGEAQTVAESIIRAGQQRNEGRWSAIGEILLSAVNQELGHARYALDLASRAVARLRERGANSELARAMLQLGSVRTMAGDLNESRADFESAIALARLSGDVLTEGLALTRLGFALVCQTELSSAASAYTQAIARFATLGSSWRRDRALFGLTVLRLKQGDIRDATQLLLELESRYGEARTWRRGRIELLKGWSEVLKGNADAALQHLQLAAEVFTEFNAQRDLALCQEYSGDALRIRGESEAALAAYGAAEALGRMVSESSDVVVEAIRKAGEVLAQCGRLTEALANARIAHRLTRRYTDRLEIEATRRLRAVIKVKRGRVQSGMTLLSAAWEGFIRIGASGEARTTADLRAEYETGALLPALASRQRSPKVESASTDAGTERNETANSRVSKSASQAEAAGSGIVSQDSRVLKAFQTTRRAAPLDLPVLILGETGTGKELFATLAHDKSGRKGSILAINCAAIPADILDAELFGHAKGAYTGAHSDRPGLIEAASGGTLFLDEIGEMTLAIQGRLLRAIEAKEIRRLGENHSRKVGTRFVGATHRDLGQMVKDGKFRADLFFRLQGIIVNLPPLRERPDDILLLADHFLAQAAARMGREFELTRNARQKLVAHSWPGNVRELRSVIERAAAMSEEGRLISEEELGVEWIPVADSLAEHMEAAERRNLLATLESVDWNQTQAARQLKLKRTTLASKLKRLGIEHPRKK